MALPTTVVVTGTFLDGNGDPCEGFVTFSNSVHLTNTTTNETLSPLRVKGELDENGEISVSIFAVDDPDWNPIDYVWTVREVISGRPFREYNVQVYEVDTTVNLEDLSPAVVNDPQYESYALANHTHTGLELEDHTHDQADVTSLVTDLAGKASTSHTHDYAAAGHNHDASYSATSHTHDTRYYTETETDTLLAGKSSTAHTHDDRYFTETEVNTALSSKSDTTHNHDATYAAASHNHNVTYYTETEVDGLLANKSDTTHDHDSDYSAIAHTHDTRYYTETETDTLLAGKANNTHTHPQSDITNLTTDLAGKANTSHSHAGSDITSGTVATARLDTGTGATQVALGNHTHAETSDVVNIGTGKNQWPSGSTMTAYKDHNGWVRLSGGIESTSTISAGTTLVTIPSGFRPVRDCQFTVRHTITSASTGTVSISASTGNVTYNSGFNSGAIMDLTGIQFRTT